MLSSVSGEWCDQICVFEPFLWLKDLLDEGSGGKWRMGWGEVGMREWQPSEAVWMETSERIWVSEVVACTNQLVLIVSYDLISWRLSFRDRNTKSWRNTAYGISVLPPGSRESQSSGWRPALQLTLRYLIPLEEAHQMVTVWSNGHSQVREPRDPGMEFIVGCSSTSPDGILLPLFLCPLIIPKHL